MSQYRIIVFEERIFTSRTLVCVLAGESREC